MPHQPLRYYLHRGERIRNQSTSNGLLGSIHAEKPEYYIFQNIYRLGLKDHFYS